MHKRYYRYKLLPPPLVVISLFLVIIIFVYYFIFACLLVFALFARLIAIFVLVTFFISLIHPSFKKRAPKRDKTDPQDGQLRATRWTPVILFGASRELDPRTNHVRRSRLALWWRVFG